MSRVARVCTAGLTVLAVAACTATPPTATKAPGTGAATTTRPGTATPGASTPGTSGTATPGTSTPGTSLSPVPVLGGGRPALPAKPATCAQPPAATDDIRATKAGPSWRVVSTDEGYGRLHDLAVGRDGAVWATHLTQRLTAESVETAFAGLRRWDGKGWRSYPLPSVQVTALSATSAASAWVFGLADGRTGLVGAFQNDTWAARRLTGRLGDTFGAGGTAARGAWAVSGASALWWTGSTWQHHDLPAAAGAVGGGSGSGGGSGNSGGGKRGGDVWTVSGPLIDQGPAARWDGEAWQRVDLPALGPPAKAESPRVRLNDVVVLGPADVWVIGGVTWLVPGEFTKDNEPLERSRPVALHWDGGEWRCRWGALGPAFTQAEPDGRDGMWVLDSTGSRLLHFSRGRWTSQTVDGTIDALAQRPGTSQVYAAGSSSPEKDLTRAILWRTR
ncbi:hypothetical protein [Nonomuraea aurantiaca]|uniref:hypothetical protein n=1 Tax=Nonomuraea aurantiaca TaxID=2878562 RepID=UPI001CDA11EC|nr:hypothetical protein [Nonomuraea aurantiaca]MCA2228322.1 hypothetical protein [Nonomuraea aurantiaca]